MGSSNFVLPANWLKPLVPQVSGSALEDLLLAMASGATGRLLDLQDLEEGERVEIFAEEYR